jgi:hypothetical protein
MIGFHEQSRDELKTVAVPQRDHFKGREIIPDLFQFPVDNELHSEASSVFVNPSVGFYTRSGRQRRP